METRGWDTVRFKLTEARVQLTSGAGAASGHACKAEVAKATIGWGGELQARYHRLGFGSRYDRAS